MHVVVCHKHPRVLRTIFLAFRCLIFTRGAPTYVHQESREVPVAAEKNKAVSHHVDWQERTLSKLERYQRLEAKPHWTSSSWAIQLNLVLNQIVFEIGVLDDLFQGESNLLIQHLKKSRMDAL